MLNLTRNHSSKPKLTVYRNKRLRGNTLLIRSLRTSRHAQISTRTAWMNPQHLIATIESYNTQSAPFFSKKNSQPLQKSQRPSPRFLSLPQIIDVGCNELYDKITTHHALRVATLPQIDAQLVPWVKLHASFSQNDYNTDLTSSQWIDHIQTLQSSSARQPNELTYTSPLPLNNSNIALVEQLTKKIPSINPQKFTSEELIARFIQWLTSNGAVIDPRIELKPMTSSSDTNGTNSTGLSNKTSKQQRNLGNLSIYACEDIPPNTSLFIIPHAITLTPFKPFMNIITGDLVKPELSELFIRNSTHDYELLYRLFYEFCNYTTSPFQPYLDILPKYIPSSSLLWPESIRKEYLDSADSYHMPSIIPPDLLHKISHKPHSPNTTHAQWDHFDTILFDTIQLFQQSQREATSFHPKPVPSPIPDSTDFSQLNKPDSEVRMLSHDEMVAIQVKQVKDYRKSLHQSRKVEYLTDAFHNEPLTLKRAASLYSLIKTRGMSDRCDIRLTPLIDMLTLSNNPNCDVLEINYGDSIVPNPESLARNNPMEPINHFFKAFVVCSTKKIHKGEELTIRFGKQGYKSTSYKNPPVPLTKDTARYYKDQLYLLQSKIIPHHLIPTSLQPSTDASQLGTKLTIDYNHHNSVPQPPQQQSSSTQHQQQKQQQRVDDDQIHENMLPQKQGFLSMLFPSFVSKPQILKQPIEKPQPHSFNNSKQPNINTKGDKLQHINFNLAFSSKDIKSIHIDNPYHNPDLYNYTTSPINQLLQQSIIRYPYLNASSFRTPPLQSFKNIIQYGLSDMNLSTYYPSTEYQEVLVHPDNPNEEFNPYSINNRSNTQQQRQQEYDSNDNLQFKDQTNQLPQFIIKKKPIESDPFYVALLKYDPQELILEQIITTAKQLHFETTGLGSFSPFASASSPNQHPTNKEYAINYQSLVVKPPKLLSTSSSSTQLRINETDNFFSSFQFSLNHISKPLESLLYLLALEVVTIDNVNIGISKTEDILNHPYQYMIQHPHITPSSPFSSTSPTSNQTSTSNKTKNLPTIDPMTIFLSPQYKSTKHHLHSQIYTSSGHQYNNTIPIRRYDLFDFTSSFQPLHYAAQYILLGLISTMIQHGMPNSTVIASNDWDIKKKHSNTLLQSTKSPPNILKSIARHNAYAQSVMIENNINDSFLALQAHREKVNKIFTKTDFTLVKTVSHLPIDLSPKEMLHADELMFASAQLVNKAPLFVLQHLFNATATPLGVVNRYWDFTTNDMGSMYNLSSNGQLQTTIYQSVGHPYQNHTYQPPRPSAAPKSLSTAKAAAMSYSKQQQYNHNNNAIPSVHSTHRSSQTSNIPSPNSTTQQQFNKARQSRH